MNQQARQDIDSADTFESDLAQLLERIRKSKWASSQLDGIVADGLEVAKKIDSDYRDDGSFSPFKLYLLYKVAFEVWSYQHQALLEILKDNKQQHFPNNSQRVLQHHNVMTNMFYDLNQLASVHNQNSLRDSWLSVWRQTISELAQFMDIPKIYPVKPKNLNFFRFRLGKLPDMSLYTKYVIFLTCLLVLGILIATLLLIRN